MTFHLLLNMDPSIQLNESEVGEEERSHVCICQLQQNGHQAGYFGLLLVYKGKIIWRINTSA
jgi:hypothetical protein